MASPNPNNPTHMIQSAALAKPPLLLNKPTVSTGFNSSNTISQPAASATTPMPMPTGLINPSMFNSATLSQALAKPPPINQLLSSSKVSSTASSATSGTPPPTTATFSSLVTPTPTPPLPAPQQPPAYLTMPTKLAVGGELNGPATTSSSSIGKLSTPSPSALQHAAPLSQQPTLPPPFGSNLIAQSKKSAEDSKSAQNATIETTTINSTQASQSFASASNAVPSMQSMQTVPTSQASTIVSNGASIQQQQQPPTLFMQQARTPTSNQPQSIISTNSLFATQTTSQQPAPFVSNANTSASLNTNVTTTAQLFGQSVSTLPPTLPSSSQNSTNAVAANYSNLNGPANLIGNNQSQQLHMSQQTSSLFQSNPTASSTNNQLQQPNTTINAFSGQQMSSTAMRPPFASTQQPSKSVTSGYFNSPPAAPQVLSGPPQPQQQSYIQTPQPYSTIGPPPSNTTINAPPLGPLPTNTTINAPPLGSLPTNTTINAPPLGPPYTMNPTSVRPVGPPPLYNNQQPSAPQVPMPPPPTVGPSPYNTAPFPPTIPSSSMMPPPQSVGPPPPTTTYAQTNMQQQQQPTIVNQFGNMSLSGPANVASQVPQTQRAQPTNYSNTAYMNNPTPTNSNANGYVNRSQPNAVDLLHERRLINPYSEEYEEVPRPIFPHEFYTNVNCRAE
jgi:hypothetical protein